MRSYLRVVYLPRWSPQPQALGTIPADLRQPCCIVDALLIEMKP